MVGDWWSEWEECNRGLLRARSAASPPTLLLLLPPASWEFDVAESCWSSWWIEGSLRRLRLFEGPGSVGVTEEEEVEGVL